VGCRKVKPKPELIRLVHTVGGAVEIDPTGKKKGRGTYLCRARECWEAGLKKNRLERALRAKIDPENHTYLLEYGKSLPSVHFVREEG
jgi:hypothetical protein